jgi:hypothetical protein
MGRRRQRGTKCEGQRDFRNVASPANPINRGPAVKNAGSETGRRDHRPMTGTRRGGVDVTGSALRRSCRAEPRCRPQIARPTKIPRASRSPQAPYHRVSLARCSARDRIRTCTPLRAPGPKPTRIPPPRPSQYQKMWLEQAFRRQPIPSRLNASQRVGMSPATSMGPLVGGFRHEDGTTLSPVSLPLAKGRLTAVSAAWAEVAQQVRPVSTVSGGGCDRSSLLEISRRAVSAQASP